MSQYFNGTTGGMPPGPPPPRPQVPASWSSLAIISFLLGLVGLPLCFLLIPGALAVLLGLIAFFRCRGSGGQKKGTVLSILGLLLGLLSLVFFFKILNSVDRMQNDPALAARMAEVNARRAPLRAAEELIRSQVSSKGQIGHGNTPEAEQIAIEFATSMKEFRAEYFTGDANSGLLSGGEFLTYCQINEDSCAFIAHVPSFRKFESDAKDALSDHAWLLAQALLTVSEVKPDIKLAVGLKGVMTYHRIDQGKLLSPEELINEDLDKRHGIFTSSSSTSDNDLLERYFPAPKKASDLVGESSPEKLESSPSGGDETDPKTPAAPAVKETTPPAKPVGSLIPRPTPRPTSPAEPEPRMETWTNVEGKEIKAAFQGVENGLVELLLENGTTANVPFAKLSAESQTKARARHSEMEQ